MPVPQLGRHMSSPVPSSKAAPPTLVPTILLVDGDAVARRYLELSLSSTKRFRVEVAEECQGALDILSNTVVDLIVCDLELEGEDGLQLLRRVRREPRWRSLPFFLTATKAPASARVSAFQQGADDFLIKPLSSPEMVARIDAVMKRVSVAKSKWRGRRYELAGNFRGLSFADILTILENGQRTGMLSIMTRRAGGSLFFEQGRIRHATFGSIQGPEAVYRFFAEPEGEFEFLPGKMGEDTISIQATVTGLLLEAAKQQDDLRLAGTDVFDAGDAAVQAAAVQDVEVVAPAADAAQAERMAQVLEDPFSLGEMLLLGRGETRDWLEQSRAASSLQVWLLTDVQSGVLWLGTMASPLSEGQIAKGLAATSRGLALSFQGDEGGGLDVLLLDEERPLELLEGLDAGPDVLIVAPQAGDWLSFSTGTRVAIAELLRVHAPARILGLGHQILADSLEDVAGQAGCRAPIAMHPMQVGDPGLDARDVLANVLRNWAAQTPHHELSESA